MLLNRLRAEFLEMPGMHLKPEQVRRLCGVERELCQTVLDSLVDARFLCVGADGTPVKADRGHTRDGNSQNISRTTDPALDVSCHRVGIRRWSGEHPRLQPGRRCGAVRWSRSGHAGAQRGAPRAAWLPWTRDVRLRDWHSVRQAVLCRPDQPVWPQGERTGPVFTPCRHRRVLCGLRRLLGRAGACRRLVCRRIDEHADTPGGHRRGRQQ